MPVDPNANIEISAFAWVPPFAQGQVRDLRVRWALEEAGLSYRERLLHQGDQDKPDYRVLQPFGQVPIFEEKGLVLFETGAIVLHIGERSEALLPKDMGARSRAVQWLPEETKLASRDCKRMVAVLENHMRQHQFLAGDRLTGADFNAAYTLDWANEAKMLKDAPRLREYLAAMYARPKAPPTIAEGFATLRSQQERRSPAA